MNCKILLFLLHATALSYSATESAIDSALKNIILCTGPSLGRKQLLIDTLSKDLKQIPFKKIFLATNDKDNLTLPLSQVPCVSRFFNPQGHQLDCLNCIIRSIKDALADCQCSDNDIILFKHESVFISDMYLVRKAVEKILDGYDIVAKYWLGFPGNARSERLNDYFHTDSFFIKVSAARILFKDITPVACFEDYQFCEEFFTKYIVQKASKVYKIDYHHSSWKDNELGFYHIPRYEEDPHWYWDKKNYHTLYTK